MQYKVGLGVLGVSLVLLLTFVLGAIFAPDKSEMAGWAPVGIIFGILGVFAGVMMVLGDRPETKRAARLRHSMSADQWDLHQNRTASRVGWGIAGVSLLVVIISAVFWNFLPGMVGMLGLSFGGAGVLSGIIVAIAYRYEGLEVAGRPADDRHAGIATVMALSGRIIIVFAFASSLHGAIGSSGMGSWAIVVVAVLLSTFEFWASFWGPRGGSCLAFRAIIQLALFVIIFFANIVSHRQHRHSSNRSACPPSYSHADKQWGTG